MLTVSRISCGLVAGLIQRRERSILANRLILVRQRQRLWNDACKTHRFVFSHRLCIRYQRQKTRGAVSFNLQSQRLPRAIVDTLHQRLPTTQRLTIDFNDPVPACKPAFCAAESGCTSANTDSICGPRGIMPSATTGSCLSGSKFHWRKSGFWSLPAKSRMGQRRLRFAHRQSSPPAPDELTPNQAFRCRQPTLVPCQTKFRPRGDGLRRDFADHRAETRHADDEHQPVGKDSKQEVGDGAGADDGARCQTVLLLKA